MTEDELLKLSKSAARAAGLRLLQIEPDTRRAYVHSTEHRREIKAAADGALEDEILRALAPAGLPILSEESGLTAGRVESGLRFVVDPLDGTFNFVKDLGPSAVCIALCDHDRPVFGVVFDIPNSRLYWGGASIGAFCEDKAISVSTTTQREAAAICTGIPARSSLQNDEAVTSLSAVLRGFAKVRMLGSAAMSLVQVARGAADAYLERGIMWWDVAAGLAIVEGAGGRFDMHRAHAENALDVVAFNGCLIDVPAARA